MADVASQILFVKTETLNQLQTETNKALADGWTPWQFMQENIGTPEYVCALVKYSNVRTVALTEIPKIETALGKLKTDSAGSTAGTVAEQIAAINTAIAAVKSAADEAGRNAELTKITNAAAAIVTLVNTQRTAIAASKDLIKNAP
jgi:hypothetical protein